MQQSVGIFGSPEEQQRQWENVSARHRPRQPLAGHADPVRARPAPWRRPASTPRAPTPTPSPSKPPRDQHGHLKNEMARTRHRQDHQVRPELQGHPDPPHHLRALPHEHHVRRALRRLLPRPAAPGPDGPEPSRAPRVSATCRFRSTGSTSVAPAATAGPASPSSPATTPATRCSTTSNDPPPARTSIGRMSPSVIACRIRVVPCRLKDRLSVF